MKHLHSFLLVACAPAAGCLVPIGWIAGPARPVAVAADPDAAWSAALGVLRQRGYDVPDELRQRGDRTSMRVDGTRIRITARKPSGSFVDVAIGRLARANAAKERRIVEAQLVLACGGRVPKTAGK